MNFVSPVKDDRILKYKDITLDLNAGTASRGDERLELPPLVFRYVATFILHKDKIISLQELDSQARQLEVVGKPPPPAKDINVHASAKNYIHWIRGFFGPIVKNYSGVGYRLVQEVPPSEPPLSSPDTAANEKVLRYGNLALDLGPGIATHNEMQIKTGLLDFRYVAALILHRGQTLSRRELDSLARQLEVQGAQSRAAAPKINIYSVVSDRVNRVRKRFGIEITNVRGRGYRLPTDPRNVTTPSPSPGAVNSNVSPLPPPRPHNETPPSSAAVATIGPVLRHGNLALDMGTGKATCDERETKMHPFTFRLVATLMTHPDRHFPFDMWEESARRLKVQGWSLERAPKAQAGDAAKMLLNEVRDVLGEMMRYDRGIGYTLSEPENPPREVAPVPARKLAS